jgi:hypothetical protein
VSPRWGSTPRQTDRLTVGRNSFTHSLATSVRWKYDLHNIDEKVKRRGPTFLWLRPHHCEMKPTKLVWAQVKIYIARKSSKSHLKWLHIWSLASRELSATEYLLCFSKYTYLALPSMHHVSIAVTNSFVVLIPVYNIEIKSIYCCIQFVEFQYVWTQLKERPSTHNNGPGCWYEIS